MAKVLTDKAIERLRGTGERQVVFDAACRGFHVVVSADGVKSYAVMGRDKEGRQVWRTICRVGEKPLADARQLAEAGRDRIRAGLVAKGAPLFPVETPPAPPKTFADEVENFLKREVRGKRRSAAEVERLFNVCILPAWKDKALSAIRRGDVTELLDKIEDERGATTADRCLAAARRLFNWAVTRDDKLLSPVVKGMARTKPAERARARVLSDDEIRLLWKVPGRVGDFARVALLTGQRREKVAAMRWADIDDEGVWEIPTAPREKANARWLTLPDAVLEIIRRQPKIGDNPMWVFPGRTGGPLAGHNAVKRAIDEAMTKANDGKKIPAWVFHDLRRTARTLMARAGVPDRHAEMALGHTIKGIEGIYNKWTYVEEKKDALAKLANLVDKIIHPPADNVVPFAPAKAG